MKPKPTVKLVKPLFIYADEGTSEVGVQSLLLQIEQKLQRPAYLITADEITAPYLQQACALIMPGGADLPYCKKLNGEKNQLIRQFVQQGGIYIGICAGAYYACEYVDFTGDGYQINGERELAFFAGKAVGSLPDLTFGRYFDGTTASKNKVRCQFDEISAEYYYHGGSSFMANSSNPAPFQVLAHYPNQQVAVIQGKFGKGQYLLSGVHFELHPKIYRKMRADPLKNTPFFEQEMGLVALLENTDYGEPCWAILRQMLGY